MTMLHYVIVQIKKAIKHKEIAFGAFNDIEGAFHIPHMEQ
jgi:hypothetical protein